MKIIILPLIKNNREILYYNDILNNINISDINTYLHIIRIYYCLYSYNKYININEISRFIKSVR